MQRSKLIFRITSVAALLSTAAWLKKAHSGFHHAIAHRQDTVLPGKHADSRGPPKADQETDLDRRMNLESKPRPGSAPYIIRSPPGPPPVLPKDPSSRDDGSRKTACTNVYESMIESKSPAAIWRNFGDNLKVSKACEQELRTTIRDFDQIVSDLSACINSQNKSPAEQRECLRLTNILLSAFVENEFRGADPADLSSQVLRQMIGYRALQMQSFTQEKADLEYFFKLVNEEQRLNPDRDLSSLKAFLISSLVQKDPEKYEQDFFDVMLEVENKSPESALASRLSRYKNNLKSPEFLFELEAFIQRNPAAPIGYYYKAAILANKGDFAAALQFMDKAIQLADSDKDFFEQERQKFGKGEKGITIRQHISLSM